MSLPGCLSPVHRFKFRFQYEWFPWCHHGKWEHDGVTVVCHNGPGWTDFFIKRPAASYFSFMFAVPTAIYRRYEAWAVERSLMAFLDKLPPKDAGTAGAAMPTDERFAKKYPALFEFMTAVCYPDGQVRTPSSLLVFAEEGQFKMCLSERDRELALWGTGGTFEEALQVLERRLASDRPDWRRSKRAKGRGRA